MQTIQAQHAVLLAYVFNRFLTYWRLDFGTWGYLHLLQKVEKVNNMLLKKVDFVWKCCKLWQRYGL